MKKFAIIGVSGYIAKKHVKCIKELNGDLVAAMDLHDNVGFLDSFFPNCKLHSYFIFPHNFCCMRNIKIIR